MKTSSGLMRLFHVGMWLGIGLAVLVWPAAWLLDAQATTVQFIAAFDDDVVELNRYTYEEDPTGEDSEIIAIYGTASGDPERVVFLDEARIIHPKENPDLVLYKKHADEDPVQTQLVYYVAKVVSIASALGALALLGLLVFFRRRKHKRLGGSPGS